MKIYVGEVVKNAINAPDQHMKKIRIAKLIGLSKTHFYEILSNPEMDPAYIIKIGKVIGKDFRKEISELKNWDQDISIPQDEEVMRSEREKLEYELLEMQRKYIHALEDIRQLQKELRVYENANKLKLT